jgi:type I restriction enzyme M protein
MGNIILRWKLKEVEKRPPVVDGQLVTCPRCELGHDLKPLPGFPDVMVIECKGESQIAALKGHLILGLEPELRKRTPAMTDKGYVDVSQDMLAQAGSSNNAWALIEQVRGVCPFPDENNRLLLMALSAFAILRQADAGDKVLAKWSTDVESGSEWRIPDCLKWHAVEEIPDDQIVERLQSRIAPLLGSLSSHALSAQFTDLANVLRPPIGPPQVWSVARQFISKYSFAGKEGRHDFVGVFESLVTTSNESAKHAREYATPSKLVNLMLDLVGPESWERVYDPCFGTGGFLVRAVQRFVQQESLALQLPIPRQIYGVELKSDLHLIATARLLLAGVIPHLRRGDALDQSSSDLGRRQGGFDCILANPPFGLSVQPAIAAQYPIASNSGDNLFLQHVLQNLKAGGRAAIVVPEGVLFRGGSDEALRQHLMNTFRIDAIVPLPVEAALTYTRVKMNILLISRKAPAESVWFVNSSFTKNVLAEDPRTSRRRGLLIELTRARRADTPDYQELRNAIVSGSRAYVERLKLQKLDTTEESGGLEFYNEIGELLDLWRSMPGLMKGSLEPELLHLTRIQRSAGVPRVAWSVAKDKLADNHWSLVASDPADEVLTEFLELVEATVPGSERVKLHDIAEVYKGLSYDRNDLAPTGTSADGGRHVRLVRVKDLTVNTTESGNLPQVKRPLAVLNEIGLKKVKPAQRLKKNDILLSISGTIGKVAMVDESMSGAVPAGGLAVIRLVPSAATIAPDVLRFLQYPPYQMWLRGHAMGNFISHLPLRVLRELPFALKSLGLVSQQIDVSSTNVSSAPTFGAMEENLPFWERLLLEDHLLQTLASTGLEKGSEGLTEWRNALSAWVGKSGDLEDRLRADGENPLGRWLMRWTERAKELDDIRWFFEYNGDCYAHLIQWKKGIDREKKAMNQDLHRWRNSRKESTINAVIEERTLHLLAHLQGDWSIECERILSKVEVAAHISPQVIKPHIDAQVELKITNNGALALRDLEAETTPVECHFTVPFLTAGASYTLMVSVDGRGEGEIPIRLDWSAYRLDGRRASGAIDLTLQVRQEAEDSLYDLGQSPYVTGSPVDLPGMFFGRKSVLDDIRRHLSAKNDTGQTRGNVILLEGNRRAGKSSILKWIARQERIPNSIPVYCSLQGMESTSTLPGLSAEELYFNLAHDIAVALLGSGQPLEIPTLAKVEPGRLAVFSLPKLLRSYFSLSPEHPYSQFKSLLAFWFEAIHPIELVLMIDEFDKLQEGIENQITSQQVPENIRDLFHSFPKLSGIFAGSRRLKKMREHYWSALFGFGYRIGLDPLEKQEAQALVTKPVEGRLRYVAPAIDKIVSDCARQPFLIQSLCSRIFEKCAQSSDRTVTPSLVKSAEDEMVRDNEHFRSLWDDAQTGRRRFILCLCDSHDGGPDPVTAQFLVAKLEENGICIGNRNSISDDLEFLLELDLLELGRTDGKPVYRFGVPLFSQWLRKHIDEEDVMQQATKEGRR